MFSLTFDADDLGSVGVSADIGGPLYLGVNDTDLAVRMTDEQARLFAQLLESFASIVCTRPFGDLQ